MQLNTSKPQPKPDQLNAIYKSLFNYSGHAIAILDPIDGENDFVISDANTSECRFANRPREEIVNRRLTEAYPNITNTGILHLINKVQKDGQAAHFGPIFYKDTRIHLWIKGYIDKLPGDQLLVILEDVTNETHRHRQQELELTILSELRNTDQLSQVIPHILGEIKDHTHATHACLYLLPEFQIDTPTTSSHCVWTYCENSCCQTNQPCDECGDLHCPHQKVLEGKGNPSASFFTRAGNFWFNDLNKLQATKQFLKECPSNHIESTFIKSGCIVALRSGEEILGIMQITSNHPHSVDEKQVEFLGVIGASIGMALGHQHAEAQLRLNENKMRTILDSMPAMLDAFDADGNIIYWNKECERVSGYTAAEAINNPQFIDLLYPSKECRKRAIHKLPPAEDFNGTELTLTDKTGTQRTISWSNIAKSMPVPGWHTWAIGQDVTHRKKMDQVLQGVLKGTSRETGTPFFRNLTKNIANTLGVKYSMLAEILPDQPDVCGTRAIWTGNDFGENFTFNLKDTPCTQTADEQLCIIAHNVTRLFPRDHLLVEMGVESYAGILLLDANDNMLGILAVMDNKPLKETKLIGSILQIFCARAASELECQHAVEEQHRLEKQLRQSQKMEAVGQLAGGIAHDFNNLLQAICGYTELATFSLEPNHPAGTDLKEVQRAANHARDLIQQLLSFSSRQVLNPKVLNLNEVVSGTCKMVRRVIGEQIDFEFTPCESIPSINADHGQLAQIIINLCVNARDAMPNGGKIRITTGLFNANQAFCRTRDDVQPGTYAIITISDTGIGMAPDVKEHIFEPFFSTKGLGKGTGLGLSTVFGIVAQHQGFINVESTPTLGSSFGIYLPACKRKPTPELNSAIQTSLDASGKGNTILLAEDEEIVRKLGITILEKAGYKVLAAHDGEAAIALFNEHKDKISFALLDVIMPRKSGPEVYEAIKKICPELPVLFATGHSFNLLENDIPHNDCEIISKPFSPSLLVRTISEMLNTSQ